MILFKRRYTSYTTIHYDCTVWKNAEPLRMFGKKKNYTKAPKDEKVKCF